jgi:hypothetical protein
MASRVKKRGEGGIVVNSIHVDLKVREARALASILPTVSSKVDLTKVGKDLQAQLEAYDEGLRRDREEKLRLKQLEQEQKRLEQLCAIKGHSNLVWDGNVKMIDCQTMPGMAIEIPECVRCHETLVKLEDGTIKPWDAWAETKEPLHPELLTHKVERLC